MLELAPTTGHRRLSLTQLEYFVAVSESGSVTRAAGHRAVSQPQIRALEDELHAPLFRRSTRGMALTPEGERLLSHARAVLELVRATPAVVRSE